MLSLLNSCLTIGLIAFLLSAVSCWIFQRRRNRIVDYFDECAKLRQEPHGEFYSCNDELMVWFAPLASLLGIAVVWWAYLMEFSWRLHFLAGIIWTVILIVTTVATFLFNSLRKDKYNDEDDEDYDEE